VNGSDNDGCVGAPGLGGSKLPGVGAGWWTFQIPQGDNVKTYTGVPSGSGNNVGYSGGGYRGSGGGGWAAAGGNSGNGHTGGAGGNAIYGQAFGTYTNNGTVWGSVA
jgi:hypothetical protein